MELFVIFRLFQIMSENSNADFGHYLDFSSICIWNLLSSFGTECQRISRDKAGYFPKRDVCFILLK